MAYQPDISPFDVLRQKKEEAKDERDRAGAVLRAKKEHLLKLFQGPEWAALVEVIKARQGVHTALLFGAVEHPALVDARASVRELQAIIDLESTIKG